MAALENVVSYFAKLECFKTAENFNFEFRVCKETFFPATSRFFFKFLILYLIFLISHSIQPGTFNENKIIVKIHLSGQNGCV